jgi:hypothetical protein
MTHRGNYQPCRQVLSERGMAGDATRGKPAPLQAGRRWPIERTHAWGNQYGKLPWCTERRRLVVEFWLAMAGAAIVRPAGPPRLDLLPLGHRPRRL